MTVLVFRVAGYASSDLTQPCSMTMAVWYAQLERGCGCTSSKSGTELLFTPHVQHSKLQQNGQGARRRGKGSEADWQEMACSQIPKPDLEA